MKNKGFTLIELLVVVSIIGVLATIVLSSLGTARSRANDASIKAALSQARTQAELQYLDTNDYSTVCDPGTKSAEIFQSAHDKGGVSSGSNVCVDDGSLFVGLSGATLNPSVALSGLDANGNIWAMAVRLNVDGWFCVDSSGASVVVPGTIRPINGSDKTC